MAVSLGGFEDRDRAYEYFNPYQRILRAIEARKTIDRAAARTFLSLAQAGEIPSWVIAEVDIDLIKAVA